VLLLGELCEREGLFAAAGARMATAARGWPVALLGLVFMVGAAVTAVLSLDATVVLLTPVVFATACGCGCGPSRRCTPAPTWPTPRRCCCRSPTSPTCSPSAQAACRLPASPPS